MSWIVIAFWFSLAATLVFGAIQLRLDRRLKVIGSTPAGIVDLELAKTKFRVEQILAAWGADERAHASRGVWLDFAFLISYGSCLFFGCLLVPMLTNHVASGVALFFGLLGLIAAGCDAVENVVMLAELKHGSPQPKSTLRLWAARVKFTLAGIAFLFFVHGLISTPFVWIRLGISALTFVGTIWWIARASRTKPDHVSDADWASKLSGYRVIILAVSVSIWALNYGAYDISGEKQGLLYAFLMWLYEYPQLSLIGVVLTLILFNIVGRGLGLARLFLDENPRPRFWGAFGASLIAGLLMATTYFVDHRFHPRVATPHVHGQDDVYNRVAGFPREIAHKIGLSPWVYAPSEQPGDHEISQGELFPRVGRNNTDNTSREDFSWRWITFILVTATPIWFTFLLPGLPIGAFEGNRYREDQKWGGWFTQRAFRRFFAWKAGILAGVVTICLTIWVGIPLTALMERIGSLVLGNSDPGGVFPTRAYLPATILFAALAVWSFVWLRSRRNLPAGPAIAAFLWIIIMIYTVYAVPGTIDQLGGADGLPAVGLVLKYWRFVLPVLALVYIGFANGDWYKLSITELEAKRDPEGRVELIDLSKPLPPNPEALDSQAVLDKWIGKVGDRRKVVILSVSGGASRAAIWVATVIEELRDQIAKQHGGEDFDRHVRLITGASGGMLGTAAYVSELFRLRSGGGGYRPLWKSLKGDFLTPVARRLALFDTYDILIPKPRPNDRGKVLEDTWVDFVPNTFGDWRPAEAEAEIPSIIFSPMMVEDGRRLLISNLDLPYISGAKGSLLNPTIGNLLSTNAVELNRLMPDRFDSFRVRTAVRLNASFPYVSPAICLPTDPPRRPVDAGYYDNYGVNIACGWAGHHLDWFEANNVDVLLIQIRDSMGQASRYGFQGAPGTDSISRGLSFLTAPLSGAGSARYATNTFRNDQDIAAVDRLISRGGSTFSTVAFDMPDGEVALNWYLSENEIDGIRNSIGRPINTAAVAAVLNWWKS